MPHTSRLAAGVLLALGLPAIGSAVGPTPVTNCFDVGQTAGTLRTLLVSAADGAAFDTSACSTITLTQGEIPIAATDISVGASTPTIIDANHNGRVFSAAGNLSLGNLTLTGGRVSLGAAGGAGGCVVAAGTLTLSHVRVTDCQIVSDVDADGGAVAADVVNLSQSQIDGNAAYGSAIGGNSAHGGGVSAQSAFKCTYSTISGNKALAHDVGEGGGVIVNAGSAYLFGCTVDGNVAQYTAGILQFGAASSSSVFSSTISGNRATSVDGGLYSEAPVLIANSTVAFNYAPFCSGIRSIASSIAMYSTIVARNQEGAAGSCGELSSPNPVTGSHNLVMHATVTVPGDTLSADPRLGPLADNGGRTPTHALALSSVAVDSGSNTTPLPSISQPSATDQRGVGFLRTVGAGTDIGAYERQAGDDFLFADGFD